MIERMVSDRLWIYTGIAGSIFGALFLAYMRDTRIGLWVYSKWDNLLDYIRDKFGWTWFDQPEDAWRKISPRIAKKIDELENRIKKLEK
tara:strand:- start:188 stop:454 length:267 start_codon:yes stop_codon:yes gene_type:complete